LTPDGEDEKKKKGKDDPDEEPRLGPVPDPWEPKHPMLPKATTEDGGEDKLPGRSYADGKVVGEDIAWVSGPGIERGKGKKLALTPEELAKMQGPPPPEAGDDGSAERESGRLDGAEPVENPEGAGYDNRADVKDGSVEAAVPDNGVTEEEKKAQEAPVGQNSRSDRQATRRPASDRPLPDRRAVPTVAPSMKYRRKVNPKVSPMTIPAALGGKTVRCPSCGAEVNTSISSYCYKCGGSVDE
jgi:hypothetical protein